MVLKTIFPDYGVRASLMLFLMVDTMVTDNLESGLHSKSKPVLLTWDGLNSGHQNTKGIKTS